MDVIAFGEVFAERQPARANAALSVGGSLDGPAPHVETIEGLTCLKARLGASPTLNMHD